MSVTNYPGGVKSRGMELLPGGLRPVVGNVFYVDPTNGGADNSGEAPDDALDTMNGALSKCTAGNGDVIIRLPGTETVTSAIEFDVAGVTVIASQDGLSPEGLGEFYATLADASYTTGPVARITARTTIIGLGFVSRDAGTVANNRGSALTIGGGGDSVFGVHLYKCRFPKWNVDNRYGIYLDGTDAVTDCTIEECTFEGVGASFDYGIMVNGAIQNLNIIGNKFRDCDFAVGYNAFAGGGPDALIASNWVLTQDKLLDSNGATAPTLVADNWLTVATGTSAFDASIATLDGQNIYVSDNHYKEA